MPSSLESIGWKTSSGAASIVFVIVLTVWPRAGAVWAFGTDVSVTCAWACMEVHLKFVVELSSTAYYSCFNRGIRTLRPGASTPKSHFLPPQTLFGASPHGDRGLEL
eukprot:scaffold7673_cov69-Alexandrium_tamarense.AAC.1